MNLKPVNSINNDGNTIRVSDGNSPIRLIFKDVKGEVINLYDNIDYFYLTKDDEQFYSVTDISYDGDEVIIRLPKLRKGKYKAEIRDKDGSIYPANEDLYILLRRSFEDDKDIYYFGHREDILNSVEPMVIQHIDKHPNKFKGERGIQGFPGRDGLPGINGKDGKDGLPGINGKDGIDGLPGKDGEKGDKGDPGLDGKDFDKNSFLVDQTMITDELKQQIAGTAPINAVPADGSLTTQKYADNSVTIDKQEEFLGIAFLNNAFGNLIDFDFVNKIVTIPRHSYITIGSKRIFYNNAEDIIVPYPTGNSSRQLIYDLETNEIKSQLNAVNNPKKALIIATWWTFDHPDTLVCYSPYSINGERNSVYKSDIDTVYEAIETSKTNLSLDAFTRHSNVGFIGNFEGAPLDFDLVNKRVVVRAGTILTGGGRRLHYNGSSFGDITIDFSNLSGQLGERSFIYDLTDDSFKVTRQGDTRITNSLIIATWWSNDNPNSLTCYGKYTINGEEVDGYNNNLSEYVTHSDLNSSDNLVFDEDKHYPLYRSDVYITEQLKLQFFFDSFFVNSKDNHIKNLNPLLTYNDETGNSMFNRGLSPVVKGREFSGSDLSIRYQNGELNTHYEKMLNVHFKKHQDITNNSPKILMIGDSQTEHGTPSFTKRALEGIGLTPKMVGTYRDYEGTPCEGRGSWAWSNYIGRNSRVGTNDITITQELGNRSSRITNPFWKVATADDKANHPEWCFEYNELEENNLNYTESTNKETATFHIFDMSFYLPKLEGDIPDVITIGLGGNDLTLESKWNKNVYEIMDLSLEIMILQIRKELPDTPIVIMPLTARGGFSDENWNPVDNKYVKWYDRCASKIKEINDDNTHLLSLFAHMSRDYIWSTEQTVLSNGVLKNVDADKTHFKELGQKQYGETLASCIVNVT